MENVINNLRRNALQLYKGSKAVTIVKLKQGSKKKKSIDL